MEKIKLNNIAAYCIGQILLTLGIVLSVKADLGISVATSPAFVLSKIIETVSFGTMNYLYHGFIFLLMLLIIREVKLRYFFSFLTAVIFGYIIDFWTYLLRGFVLDTPVERIIVFIVSIFLMSFAIATFVVSKLPLLPFDIFVRKISEKFGFSFSRVKLIFDLSNLALAVVLGLIFFRGLVGVWWGTLIFALVLGPSIGFIMKNYEKMVKIGGRLPAFLLD
ncbi:MAG TPA: hypothetical protein DCO79_01245 [Spirochaeta sp.]|nr:hypothetical protein [Spirochaeta sp.]